MQNYVNIRKRVFTVWLHSLYKMLHFGVKEMKVTAFWLFAGVGKAYLNLICSTTSSETVPTL